MGDVIVISTSIVRPESYKEESDRVKIHLTPWDLFFLRAEYPQRGLLFPQPDPETHIIPRLKSSLSAALKIFYPFAGRLVKTENEDGETASLFVDCDGSGVKFIHASAKTISVSDVLEPADGYVPEFLNHFFPANEVLCCEGISESLLAFQVTELKDGVFIGYGYNHMVADGSSFWNFFKTWSEICSNGFDSDHRRKFPPLLLRRWFLDGIDYPIQVPISETVTPNRAVVTSSLLQEKIFRFTSGNISELKEKANGEVNSDDRKISSLQAVSAYMWRSIIRNSDLNPEEVIHCKLMVDLKRRLNPPLEKECFGNMVGFATAATTVGEMLNNGLGWAALLINKAVGSQTNEEFRQYAEDWVNKRSISNWCNNSIIIASSPRFNVYGHDFGWGKPIAIRAGRGNTISGRLIAYPGIEGGNIEIHTCLSSSILVKLSTDEEFLMHEALVHAAAKTITFNEVAKSDFVDGLFGSFFPATGIKNYQGVSNPLLMVQVTEIKDGIFIGYGYNHTVADGKSIWRFINKWSEICSMDIGSGSMEISSPLRGWFLDAIEYPIHVPDPEIEPSSYGTSTTSNMLQEIVFHLTKENVLRLKAKVNGEAGSGEDGKISSFQAALGHIWRSRVKNSDMSREEESHCRVPIDMRQRLNPVLKEECFGNVIQTGIVTVNVGELLDHGTGWLAMQINKMVRSQTDENAKTYAQNWVKNVEIPVDISGTLIVTSSPRFNVYGNDFGWGKPIRLRSGAPFYDGKLVVFQGIEEGGFEFQTCFPREAVVKLIKDADFLEFVDIAS